MPAHIWERGGKRSLGNDIREKKGEKGEAPDRPIRGGVG